PFTTYLPYILYLFFFPRSRHPRPPPSFPTRRSSDLGNPAVNYYGVVRPEQQFYNSFQQLSQQVAANQIQLGDVEAETSQPQLVGDRKSTRLNSSHVKISYAVFCLKKKKKKKYIYKM